MKSIRSLPQEFIDYKLIDCIHTEHQQLEFSADLHATISLRYLENQVTFISRTTSLTHVRVYFSLRFVFNCNL